MHRLNRLSSESGMLECVTDSMTEFGVGVNICSSGLMTERERELPRSVFVLVIKGLRKLHDKRSPYSHSIHLILLLYSLFYSCIPSPPFIYLIPYTSLLPLDIDPQGMNPVEYI